MAAPFLGSLGTSRVRAQPRAATRPPQRLIVMFTPYGCVTTRFFPANSHGTLLASDLQSTTLKHLAPHVGKLLLPRGIRAMNEWTATMVRGQGNDIHTQVTGSYFTCQPVTPNSNEPFSFDDAKFRAMPVGPSLDHVIARQLSPGGTPLLMQLANQNASPSWSISYSAPEVLYPGVGLPSEIFAQLTGVFEGDGPISADTYEAARGKSIIDLVRSDLDALQRFDMSRADRLKLEAWKELLHETGGAVAAQCSKNGAAALGVTQELIDGARASATSETDVLTQRISDTMDGADLYSNLAVLAALCNANPVIFLKYPAVYHYRGLGMTSDSDTLAHRVGSATLKGTCVKGILEKLLTIDDYYARKFAYLVKQLDSIDEGHGTLLDNTATVWFQEVSDGCARNLNNLPIVQAGSAGGYFKTGWAINVEDGASNLTSGNSELGCREGESGEIDALSQATGTPPTQANAPINKYFCNLMNALGVKAGPDGFPQKDGAAEVTHFGMYDRTEDFIGGGTNPPTIHNPGEFVALKANA